MFFIRFRLQHYIWHLHRGGTRTESTPAPSAPGLILPLAFGEGAALWRLGGGAISPVAPRPVDPPLCTAYAASFVHLLMQKAL